MIKPDSERYGGRSDVWADLSEIVASNDIPMRDLLESFPVYSRRINITRFLAHYELFRMVRDVPGHIVECGVYQGASFFAFAKLLEIFSPGDRIRQVIGFDSFQGLALTEKDGPEYPNRSKIDGGWKSGHFKKALMALLDLFHRDSFVPHAPRARIVEGDILETVPKYVSDNPGIRISLLHLDVDVYKPTLCALQHLYPRVVSGGVVVLDEYAMEEWGGESAAFEEYFNGKPPKTQKFPWTSTPGAYFVKE
jgi:Macrocin-O-methyltransferase (TylF)